MIIYYIFIFVIGLLVGSFLNVCIFRIPEGKSIVWPPSHCTSCNNKLRILDLVPVISYLFLRGKCRNCKEKISVQYPLVELLTAIIFLLLFIKYSFSISLIAYAYLMSILIAVFFIDLKHRIIPDGLVIAGIIGGLAIFMYNLFIPMEIYGDAKWWNPLIGSLSGSGALFIVAIIGMIAYKTDDAMGMGDVKIFIPIGLFLGWRMCIVSLILSIFAGGLSGLFLIITGIKKKKDAIPFGPFIVFAVFITIIWGWDIIKWYLSSNGL